MTLAASSRFGRWRGFPHADPDAMFASHEAGYAKQLKPGTCR